MPPLPVQSVKLDVGKHPRTKPIAADAKRLVFDVALEQGDTQARGTLLDQQGNVIAGAYYIYVRPLQSTARNSER